MADLHALNVIPTQLDIWKKPKLVSQFAVLPLVFVVYVLEQLTCLAVDTARL